MNQSGIKLWLKIIIIDNAPTFFPTPIPCSPVHVPSIDSARETKRSLRRWASLYSISELGSKSMIKWKFPSPRCPTIGAKRKYSNSL